jgi:hypothetical protein
MGKAKMVLNFFDWCYHNGQQMPEKLDYVPVPDNEILMLDSTRTKVIHVTNIISLELSRTITGVAIIR